MPQISPMNWITITILLTMCLSLLKSNLPLMSLKTDMKSKTYMNSKKMTW